MKKRLLLIKTTSVSIFLCSVLAAGSDVTGPTNRAVFPPPILGQEPLLLATQFSSAASGPKNRAATPQKITKQIWGRHATQVQAIAISGDDRWLACAPDDFSAVLWDLSTGKIVRVFPFQYQVQALAFNPKSPTLAVGTLGGEIQLWGINDSKPIASAKFSGVPTQIVYSAEGRVLIVGFGDGYVRLLSATTLGEQKSVRAYEKYVLSLSVAPNGRTLATGGHNVDADERGKQPGVIKVWSYPSLTLLRSINAHDKAIGGLAFRPDGAVLASASDDHTVKVWDTGSWTETLKLDLHQDAVRSVAFSPTGDRLVSGGQDGLTLFWSGKTFGLLKASPMYVGFVTQLRFTADGKFLVRAGSAVDVVSVPQPIVFRRLESFAAGVYATALSSGATWLASGGADRQFRLLKTATFETRKVSFSGWITAISFSPDEKYVAVGTARGMIAIFATATLSELARMEAHFGAVTSLVFAPDGNLLVSAGDDAELRIWSAGDWKAIAEKRAHENSISAVDFDQSGTKLFSCSHDGTVALWEIPSMRELARTSSLPYTPLSLSVGMSDVAVGTFGGSIQLLDKGDVRVKSILRGYGRPVLALSFDPERHLLASSDDQGVIAIWDGASHATLWKSKPTGNDVFSISWYPNSQGFITGDSGSNVTAWSFGQ